MAARASEVRRLGFRSGYVALCAIGLGWGAAARAHEFSCEQTLDGARVREIVEYPATLRYQFTVTNTDAIDTSEALGTEDALLAPSGFRFTPAVSFSLPGGASVSSGHTLTLNDEAECLALAAKDGRVDRFIDNAFTVTWDMSATVCTTRAVCGSPAGEPPAPPECQPGQGATRSLGFWKTHVDAAAACLALGPVDVGLATLTTMGDVEGLLWGSPARFADGAARGDLDRERFLLARELLVATCNTRVLGAVPASPDLLSRARQALAGTDCAALSSLGAQLERFHGCAKDAALPGGTFGKADPRLALRLAKDASAPSGGTCAAGTPEVTP